MTTRVLVFQHVAHEHLGHFAAPLKEEGVEFEYVRAFEKDLKGMNFESLGNPSGLIFLGGPMSVNDEASCPFITPELKLIEAALALKKPLLGICLGSQLIAKALGAKVYPGRAKEIGWYDLTLNPFAKSDSLFSPWPQELKMFQWHGETFELPGGADRLASSPAFENQAFRWRKEVYGLQFHPEITRDMVEDWIRRNPKELAETPLPHDGKQILAQTENFLPPLKELAEITIKNWTQLLTLP